MKIGSIVECINGKFDSNHPFIHLIKKFPIKGKFYTIRNIEIDRINNVGILLEEISNPLTKLKSGKIWEPSFKMDRFREVEGLPDIAELLEEELIINN
jgi:hypothetical protein